MVLLPEPQLSKRPIGAVWLALIVIYICPYWLFPYFPSQDGPSHLYNAGVLASYESSPIYQQYYAVHLSPAGNVLAMGSTGLREAVIHENPVATADPVQNAIKDALAGLVLVEAQRQIIVHGAARLGHAERVDELHVTRQRIGIALRVARGAMEERRKVADRRETESDNQRISRRVRELVQVALLERRNPSRHSDTAMRVPREF